MRTIHDVAPDERESFIRQAMANMSRASSGRVCRPALTASAAPARPAVRAAGVGRKPVPAGSSSFATTVVPSRPAAVRTPPRSGFSDRLVAAVHEAGHAVAALVYGGDVRSAEVFVRDDRPVLVGRDGWKLNGVCMTEALPLVAHVRQHLITAAGPAAEAIARHGQNPTPAQLHGILAGTKDHQDLQRHALTASSAVGVSDPVSEVLPVMRRCWPAIAQLACDMDDGRTLTHEDVAAALGLSKDRGLHSFELANIAAGLRPIPNPPAFTVTRAAV